MMALLLVLGAVPGSLLATLSTAGAPMLPDLDAEYARLDEVRELLVRREALRRSLVRRVDTLATEIETLRERREQTRATLLRERDEAAWLERELDRLVPRFLERAAAVEARRGRAARALADLAGMSRQAELDSTIRSRLLAISPVMLERLHRAEDGLVAQRRASDRASLRHHAIEARSPALLAERQRLELMRQQRKSQQRAAGRRLESLSAAVDRLRDEEDQLARYVLRVENAYLARAEPHGDEPALPDDGLAVTADGRVAHARVKGSVDRSSSPAVAVNGMQPAASQVVSRLDQHHGTRVIGPELKVQAQLPAMPPAPAKPINAALKGGIAASSLGASLDASDVTSPQDVVYVEPASLIGKPELATPRRRDHGRQPIMPIRGEIVDRGRPEITILAAADQPVAAPDSGKVAFAGWFRSYGLLLIIEHPNDYHTLLWGFGRLDVDVGDRVHMGQIVGAMGSTESGSSELHVEIRQNGRPVNPMQWLAASSDRVRG